MVFPVRRAWVAVSARVKARKKAHSHMKYELRDTPGLDSHWSLWISAFSFCVGFVDTNPACVSSNNGWHLRKTTCSLADQPIMMQLRDYLLDAPVSLGDGFSFSGGKYSDESSPADEWFKQGKFVKAQPVGGTGEKAKDPIFGLAMGGSSQASNDLFSGPGVVTNEVKSPHRSTPDTIAAVSVEDWTSMNVEMSPNKALRAAMLKSRFADTIFKATHQNDEKLASRNREAREGLEREKQQEICEELGRILTMVEQAITVCVFKE
ncbi:hypothetical protein CASFOL_002451 [Castilleja foliolosa]|uniref:Uncharacterized protein n=1 Tax=Castilleja foliolosa TaxID=1961234 RepID=A0ABD3EEB8_9LAMI